MQNYFDIKDNICSDFNNEELIGFLNLINKEYLLLSNDKKYPKDSFYYLSLNYTSGLDDTKVYIENDLLKYFLNNVYLTNQTTISYVKTKNINSNFLDSPERFITFIENITIMLSMKLGFYLNNSIKLIQSRQENLNILVNKNIDDLDIDKGDKTIIVYGDFMKLTRIEKEIKGILKYYNFNIKEYYNENKAIEELLINHI